MMNEIPSPVLAQRLGSGDEGGNTAAGGTFLRNLWYFAMPSHGLRTGKMIHKQLMGEPVVLGRTTDGKVFALRDICPHRGIPLSYGQFDGREVECPYHGWKFNPEGRCTVIPSLTQDQDLDPSRIKVRRYPVQETQGNIWVYFGDSIHALPEVPRVPAVEDHYQFHISMIFPCNIDHAVIGLMDPAHGPYVHKSVIWRTKKDSYEKEKAFSPASLGWKMDRHAPSRNSKAYKFLGGEMSTEISFGLPSVRIEHVKTDKYSMCGLTACTPLGPMETEVHHTIYCDVPWFGPLKPALKWIARRFLGQDGSVVAQQQVGLKYDPSLMLINDADMMAKWYFRLKKEFVESQAQGRAFENPVKPCVLRWRS